MHCDQAKRVLDCLINTVDHKISYDKNEGFNGFADASLETCKRTGKSTTGYILMHAGGPVIWRSFKQTSVATSTGEAEHMALSPLCKECICAAQLGRELGFEQVKQPMIVFDDSEPAIAIAMGAGLTNRSRSIRLAYHNVKDCVVDKTINLQKISGKQNPADILTKPLSKHGTGICCNIFFRK